MGFAKGKNSMSEQYLTIALAAEIRAGSVLHETALGAAENARPMSLTREIALWRHHRASLFGP
jgi:hypothetical protein